MWTRTACRSTTQSRIACSQNLRGGGGHGLLQLGAGEAGSHLPPALGFWRAFAVQFVTALCGHDGAATARTLPLVSAPSSEALTALIDEAPPMHGGEYLRAATLRALWESMEQALRAELAESGQPLQDFLKARDSRWRFVGRVHFNLAENRKDAEWPFAFMATYTAGARRPRHAASLAARRGVARIRRRGQGEQLLKLLEPLHAPARNAAG